MQKIISYILLVFLLLGFIAFAVLPFISEVISASLSINLLLVCLTGAYAVLTFLILHSNNELVEITNRPYIVFSLPQKKDHVLLKIENIGKTPAYDLKINIKPKLDSIQGYSKESSKFLEQTYLRPNEVIKHSVISASNLEKREKDETTFEIRLKYQDFKGKKYTESYKIDTKNYIYLRKAKFL